MGRPTDLAGASFRQRVTIAGGQNLSDVINIDGIYPRGLGVAITQDNWTAANIAISVCEDPDADTPLWIPLKTDEGPVAVATGIATDGPGLYPMGSSAWLLGAFPYMRLESVDTATGAALNQVNTQSLIVALVV